MTPTQEACDRSGNTLTNLTRIGDEQHVVSRSHATVCGTHLESFEKLRYEAPLCRVTYASTKNRPPQTRCAARTQDEHRDSQRKRSGSGKGGSGRCWFSSASALALWVCDVNGTSRERREATRQRARKDSVELRRLIALRVRVIARTR